MTIAVIFSLAIGIFIGVMISNKPLRERLWKSLKQANTKAKTKNIKS